MATDKVFRMPPETMSLAAARVANGLDAHDPRYDQVKVAVAPAWLRKAWIGPVRAMALPRHIYVSQDWFDRIAAGQAKELLAHESVHIDQWRRHGRIGFLAKYLGDYLRGRAAGLPHAAAYRAIPFERDASSRIE